ncbi:ribosome biogenesis GTP-binding protein YihA/YsxC [Candidatus Latescibacterota bacterium]
MIDVRFHSSVFNLKDMPAFGYPEICISGRSNVGKSSMINCLSGRKQGLAKTSQTPGKTRSLNYYLVDGSFFLVDLPGYGFAKISKSQKAELSRLTNSYLNGRKELNGIIQLIDSRHGPVSGDLMMLDWIEKWCGNALYVFTKTDKLSARNKSMLEKTFNKEFGLENTVMFSANTGAGSENIWSWIYNAIKKINK